MAGRKREARPGPTGSWAGFVQTVDPVERAKGALMEAVPTARAPGIPLAEALIGFEDGLREARDRMSGWADAGFTEEWEACRRGLERALDGAERLRLKAPALGYEALLGALGDLIAPLEPFHGAADRFRSLGLRPGRRLRWREPHGAC